MKTNKEQVAFSVLSLGGAACFSVRGCATPDVWLVDAYGERVKGVGANAWKSMVRRGVISFDELSSTGRERIYVLADDKVAP